MLGFDFWAQLVIVLVALFYGARKGGMALHLMAASPHHPRLRLPSEAGQTPGRRHPDDSVRDLRLRRPLQVPAASTASFRSQKRCSASTRARSAPRSSYLCWFLALLCGTGHVIRCSRLSTTSPSTVRPERPMAASTIASRCPSSAHRHCRMSMIALCDGYQVGGKAFGFIQLFSITMPGALVGLLADLRLLHVPRRGPRQGRRIPEAHRRI